MAAASAFLKQLQKSLSGAFVRAFKDTKAGQQACYALDDALGKIGLGPVGTILPWHDYGGLVTLPVGWQLCDGSAITDVDSPLVGKNTPALNSDTDPIFIGGYVTIGATPTLVNSNLPAHTHSAGTYAVSPNPHSHAVNTTANLFPSGTAQSGPGSTGGIASSAVTLTMGGSSGNPNIGSGNLQYPHHLKAKFIIRIK